MGLAVDVLAVEGQLQREYSIEDQTNEEIAYSLSSLVYTCCPCSFSTPNILDRYSLVLH